MTLPDLAAKAREIVRATICPEFMTADWPELAVEKKGAAIIAHGRILSALTETDAAATERAAKVVDERAAVLRDLAKLRAGRESGVLAACAATYLESAATAIRNQEKPDV